MLFFTNKLLVNQVNSIIKLVFTGFALASSYNFKKKIWKTWLRKVREYE